MRDQHPACAACRFRREKCQPDCPFASSFPFPDAKEDFANVHRLFGYRNVRRMTADLPPHLKEIAMNCIKYEANFREKNPIGGCCRVICNLMQQLDSNLSDLGIVRAEIELHKKVNARVREVMEANIGTSINQLGRESDSGLFLENAHQVFDPLSVRGFARRCSSPEGRDYREIRSD